MGKPNKDDDEGNPSPEMVMAHTTIVNEAFSIAQLMMWVGQRPANTAKTHPNEESCITIRALAASIQVIELEDGTMALGFQPADAPMFETLPLQCICIKNYELFFMSRAINLNGVEIPAIGICTGRLIFSDPLKKLIAQSHTRCYKIKLVLDDQENARSVNVLGPMLANEMFSIIHIDDNGSVKNAWDKLVRAMQRDSMSNASNLAASIFG